MSWLRSCVCCKRLDWYACMVAAGLPMDRLRRRSNWHYCSHARMWMKTRTSGCISLVVSWSCLTFLWFTQCWRRFCVVGLCGFPVRACCRNWNGGRNTCKHSAHARNGLGTSFICNATFFTELSFHVLCFFKMEGTQGVRYYSWKAYIGYYKA